MCNYLEFFTVYLHSPIIKVSNEKIIYSITEPTSNQLFCEMFNISNFREVNSHIAYLQQAPVCVYLYHRAGELVILLFIDAVIDHSYYVSFAELG